MNREKDSSGFSIHTVLTAAFRPFGPVSLPLLHQKAAQLRGVEVLELLEKDLGVLAGHSSIMPQEKGGSTGAFCLAL